MHHHDQPNGIQPRPDQSERSSGVEEFISKTTHELNNVLTIVRDYAQLLEMAIPDGESKKNAQLVFNGATKASKIAGTLLAFARAQITKKKTVSLNEILQRALELKSDDLNSNKIRIVKDLDPSLPSTLIDPNQLQQIFLDLITQATTAMKMTDQERILSIVTRNVGNKVQIRFSDNSPRMPGQDSSKISKSLSAGQEDGNGAGLLNSYEIMRTEAAKIRIENQSGTETTYFVELPIPTDEVQKTINHNHSSRFCSFSGKKGLLIDDDVQVMKLLSNLFKIEGCETEVVPDGKLALEKIDRSSYDFILCDVKMPTMNGITLYQQLNKKGSACLDKIIFITGDVISYDAEEFLRSVKNPVLLKPFNLEEVKETVQRVLNRLQSENGKTAQGPEK
jgi:CheY-like chemotaxis protein